MRAQITQGEGNRQNSSCHHKHPQINPPTRSLESAARCEEANVSCGEANVTRGIEGTNTKNQSLQSQFMRDFDGKTLPKTTVGENRWVLPMR